MRKTLYKSVRYGEALDMIYMAADGKITELDPIRSLISVEGPFGDDNIPIADIVKVQSMY